MTTHKLDDMLGHSGIKGMRWGVRRSETNSKTKKSSGQSSKTVKTSKFLAKSIAAAVGLPHGNPDIKLNSKSERVVGDILHYTMIATTGGSSTTSNHRKIGGDRNITKGEKIVAKHLDRVVKVGNAVGGLI